ncbi:unnamed protein product, partial [Dicrocoelium dendriticum]
ERLRHFSDKLALMGLSINQMKSTSVNIVADRSRKLTILDTAPLDCGDCIIPSLQPEEKFTMLGLPFSWKGKLPPASAGELRAQLEEITKAPLKPYQRLELLKTFLLPRHLHKLCLAVVHKQTLKRMDRLVRAHVRKWLRLPTDTNLAYFHASIGDFGIGIPCLSATIPLLRKDRLERHLNNAHPITSWAIRDPAAGSIHRLARSNVTIGNRVVMDKVSTAEAWKDA